MINQTSEEFRAIFLLNFTRELIRNSREGAISGLKNILKEKNEEIKREIDRLIKSKKHTLEIPVQSSLKEIPVFNIPRHRKIIAPPINIQPRIQESQLPPRLQYLQPIPTSEQIDLGKLNPLILDHKVSSIECYGADKPVMVRIPELKKTGISLALEEMNQIIRKFSESTRIPVNEGNFKVVFGRLILSAEIFQEDCLKFTIKKIILQPSRNFG